MVTMTRVGWRTRGKLKIVCATLLLLGPLATVYLKLKPLQNQAAARAHTSQLVAAADHDPVPWKMLTQLAITEHGSVDKLAALWKACESITGLDAPVEELCREYGFHRAKFSNNGTEYLQQQSYIPLPRPPSHPHSRHELCVVGRFSSGQTSHWPGFLSSLAGAASADDAIRVILVETDTSPSDISSGQKAMRAMLEQNPVLRSSTEFQALRRGNFNVELSDITNNHRTVLDYRKSLGLLTDDNGFGYPLTDVILAKLLASDHTCSYVMVTNGDNAYHTDLLKSTRKARDDSLDLVSFHFISHHYHRSVSLPRIDIAGKNVRLRTRMEENGVDLGAVLFRAQFMADHRTTLTFCQPGMAGHKFWTADGKLVAAAVSTPDATFKVIQEVLFFHQ